MVSETPYITAMSLTSGLLYILIKIQGFLRTPTDLLLQDNLNTMPLEMFPFLFFQFIANITNMAAMQISIIENTMLLALVYGLEVLCDGIPLKNMQF
jgi:hypothetical protein